MLDRMGGNAEESGIKSATSSAEADLEVESLATERLTFFSDAVVAIALTLLALELPTPDGISPAEIWRSLGSHFDAYLAFCLSFVVIAAHWTSHHDLFRWLRRSDEGLRTLNLAWLFTIVITPFVTRIISEGPDAPPGQTDTSQPLRFALYAVVQVVTDAVYMLMVLRMQRRKLFRPNAPASLAFDCYLGAGAFGAAFGLSIPLFFVTRYAWILWIVIPVGTGIWHRRIQPRRRRRTAGTHPSGPSQGA
jgi:uncharacterized membrane protein